MHALTVRWSLAGAAEDVAETLSEYVEQTSYLRFSGMKGLAFKTWRMRRGEWFEGCYVFENAQSRQEFEESFREGAADSPVSGIVGSPPVLIEPCEVVAVAEGAAGFAARPTYA